LWTYLCCDIFTINKTYYFEKSEALKEIDSYTGKQLNLQT